MFSANMEGLAGRILAHLASHEGSLISAWDVPRSLSQPGISEALSVSRAALHDPIKRLEEGKYIQSRKAHVIGLGGRRRVVFHITEMGRSELGQAPPDTAIILGNAPPLVKIYGRSTIIEDIRIHLHEKRLVHLVGLAGIGRTALGRVVAEQIAVTGKRVHWANADINADWNTLAREWFSNEIDIRSLDGLLQKCASLSSSPGGSLLELDNAERLPKDLRAQFDDRLRNWSSEINTPLLLISRSPSPYSMPKLRVHELESSASDLVLGPNFDVKTRQRIYSTVGGHPLGLRLQSIEDASSTDLSSWVRENVLDHIGGLALDALDELALGPGSIPSHLVAGIEALPELDERAILRVVGDNVSLAALVVDVHLSQMSAEYSIKRHRELAEYHSLRDGDIARSELRLHHLAHSDPSSAVNFLSEEGRNLISERPGAILSAMNQLEDIDGGTKFVVEAQLELGLVELAEAKLGALDSLDRHRCERRIARIQGDHERSDESHRALCKLLSPVEELRESIAYSSLLLADHLPDEPLEYDSIISELAISSLEKKVGRDDRDPTITISLAMLKHAFALLRKDFSQADLLRQRLGELGGHDDPLVLELVARAAVAASESTAKAALMKAYQVAQHPYRKASLSLLLLGLDVDALGEHAPEHVLSLVVGGGSHAQRIGASAWYWIGKLDAKRTEYAWSESHSRYASAGCVKAASALRVKISDMLRSRRR